MYGDYNFFDDREGGEQRRWMLDMCKDFASPLVSDAGSQLAGTFVGFANDEFKQSLEKPSRLDHIFSANIAATGPCVSPYLSEYRFDNSTYAGYNYPSDHLALLLEFEPP